MIAHRVPVFLEQESSCGALLVMYAVETLII
jgi:hypothetical protein